MRKLGFSLAVAAAMALTLAGPAIAQLPGQETCSLTLLQADGNPDTGGFAVDERRTFTFEILNNGSASASADIFVSQSPRGWDWPDNLAPIEDLASGDRVERSVEVSFTGEVERETTLEIRLQNVQCDSGVTGPSIEGSSNGPQSLALTHAPLPTDAGDDGLPLAWIVFGVIVAGAVIGVPVVYRSRSTRIAASCEESEKDVIAGRGTSFPITLKNKGSDPVPVKLEVSDVQEGWSALTTLPDLELGGKETRTVYMMVRAPPDAKPGDLCVAKLQVKPEGGSAQEVKTLARVDKTEDDAEAEPGEAAEPGEDDEADTEA